MGSDDSGEEIGAGVVLGADGGGVESGRFVGAERVAIGGAHGSKGARPDGPAGRGVGLRAGGAGCGGPSALLVSGPPCSAKGGGWGKQAAGVGKVALCVVGGAVRVHREAAAEDVG